MQGVEKVEVGCSPSPIITPNSEPGHRERIKKNLHSKAKDRWIKDR